jgi:hypothetical protein
LFPIFRRLQTWIQELRAFRTILSEFLTMSILSRLVALGLTLAIAACATAPAVDLTPPPRKMTDAKTQLESGKRY